MKQITFFLFICICWQLHAQGPFTPPYSTDFNTYTSEAEFQADWKFENNFPTDQAGVWGFDYTAYFGYNSSNCPFYFTASDATGDDWLFSPGFNLLQGTTYNISFLIAGAADGYTEKMKVFTGTADTSIAMNQILHDFTSITSAVFEPFSVSFTVPAAGVYYFGFQALSDADNFGILIDNFSIDNGTGMCDYESSVTKFTNPCSGILHFSSVAALEINLYSIDGRLLLRTVADKQLNLSGIPDGIYFIRFGAEQAKPLVIRQP